MDLFDQFPIQLLTRNGEPWLNAPELICFLRLSPDIDVELLADCLEEICFSRSGLDSGGDHGP